MASAPPVGDTQGKGAVLRAAGAMGIATFFSRILGLVREQVFAILFGAGFATDAFQIAFRIPNLLRDLFAEGAMSAALVPTFTRVRTQEGDARAWRLAGLVFRILTLVVGVIAVVGMVFTPELVGLYAGEYKTVPGKFELTVQMTRIMFPFFPLVALAAAFMGILNACGKFFLPAFSSALFNLSSIVVGVAFSLWLPRFGIEPIVGMAIGVVVGGAVQAFCQLPELYRQGYRWQPRTEGMPIWSADPALRSMMLMMVPGTIGLAATQINILINSSLASSQGNGAVSWLNYAFRLMQFPIGIFGVSMAAATLPRVSKLWTERNLDGIRSTLQESLRHVFAINLPASAGLAFLGYPIIQLLFEYGRFTSEDTWATAKALAAYSVGLSAYSAVKVLVPACYALGITRIAVISSVLSVTFTITLNLIMIGPFSYVGLALGTSLAAMLNLAFLLGAIRKLMMRAGGTFPLGGVIRAFMMHLGVALVMGVICYFSHRVLDRWVPESVWAERWGTSGKLLLRSAKVSLLVLEGAAVVVLLAQVFRLEETTQALELFTGKLKKKLSRIKK